MKTNPIAPFSLDFDLATGMCKSGRAKPTHRFVSNMVSQFYDTAAAEAIVRNGDEPRSMIFMNWIRFPKRRATSSSAPASSTRARWAASTL